MAATGAPEEEEWPRAMKVTVNFGNVGVIVPCGSGDILVRNLTELAVTRYKKATGKPSSARVDVHNLKSCSDGGILDPDDRLGDVADDREQIIAIFEEDRWPLPPDNAGDGTSSSSVGTGSPDIFGRAEDASREPSNCVEVEIGHRLPLGVASLQVRRGSEPALNRLLPPALGPHPSKRWSAAVIVDDDLQHLSLTGLRKEPLGGSSPEHESNEQENDQQSTCIKEEKHVLIVLKNEVGPLGIHVVPDYDKNGRDMGLVIQGIEPGGRIDRDGRLHVSDRIIEINGHSLHNVSFQKAQDIFKDALKAPEIKLCLLKGNSSLSGPVAVPKKPPPVYPKPAMYSGVKKDLDIDNELVEGEERGGINTKVATITPTKKIPPIIPHRNPNTALTANTRKIGKRIHIQLTKGSEGLGFSVTTRDNPAGGNCPIYIKNILPKGAAIQDGRLKPGDRLLEVNSIEMTGKSQTEAVSILRNTPLGGTVELVVSRQEIDTSPSSTLSRDKEMTTEKSGETIWKRKEIFTFEISLNDAGSTGLGVSVKGKTSTTQNGSIDLGIFVKSVIPGGAAFKDGRLKTNDQLININGTSLLGMTNSEAMETLRRAMSQKNGINPTSINLSISRRIQSTSQQTRINKTDDDNHHERNSSVLSNVTNSDSSSTSVKNINIGNISIEDSSLINDISHNTMKFLSKDVKAENSERKTDIRERENSENKIVNDRLTGELYSHSKQENWNINKALHAMSENRIKDNSATTLKTPSGEMVLIENDVQHWPSHGQPYNKSDVSNNVIPSKSESSDLGTEKTEVKYDSQLSLEDNNNFCRDGFGRQSISEKRHAQLDAKNTDTYQRNKKAREERERHKSDSSDPAQSEDQIFSKNTSEENKENANGGQQTVSTLMKSNSADSLVSLKQCNNERSCQSPGCPYHAVTTTGDDNISSKSNSIQLGPSLGMRKSSSLESLQTMVHELQKREEVSEFVPHPTTRVIRGRGCNESFRAAVDRSYEAPVAETMETLEEESESGSSGCQATHIPNHSNFILHSSNTMGNNSIQDTRIDSYQKKIKVRKKGIFKGLGSVFKFGKNKKLGQEAITRLSKEELEQEAERLKARLSAKEEQERIQEQYQKLLDQQKEQENNSKNSHTSLSMPLQTQGMITTNPTLDLPFISPSRQERMQQLRAQHQRRHQERHGLYPQDEQEEWYEKEIKEKIDKKQITARQPLPSIPLQQICHNYISQRRVFPKRYETEVMHSRSHSFDIYKEMERPRSRMGIAADPNKYSHYMNYKEIQQHLRQIQQNWQQAPRKDRPISNYYEYESATRPHLSPNLETHTNSLPRRNQSGQRGLNPGQSAPPFHHQHSSRTDYQSRGQAHYPTSSHLSNASGSLADDKRDGSKV